ncbi:MAG TPA: GntR family transcriptional regulator [Solirubrobacteraceae bacterium]|nr:GntR family transcriptional regulator [Solirubrobacteraceae bacterium]
MSDHPVERHYTKTEVALRSLRMGIASGRLAPGQRLGIRELTKDLAMSPTPVREALRLLQADGLVAYRPHHGMVVAAPSLDEIRDTYRLRKELEPLATRWAVPLLTPDQHERLAAHHAGLVSAVDLGNNSTAIRDNAAWHWVVYEASGSDLMISFIRRLWDIAPWRTVWVVREPPDILNEQHIALHAAVTSGDADEAARLMHEHIATSERSLFDSLRMGESGDGSEPQLSAETRDS